MSKAGRTYCVFRFVPGFNRAVFASSKRQGVIQTDFDTVRKSLDGTMGILCWRGPMPPAVRGFALWTGGHTEMLDYLDTNNAAWNRPVLKSPAQPTRTARVATAIRGLFVRPDNTIEPMPVGVQKRRGVPRWAWAAAGAAAAAVGYGAYTLFG